MTEQSNTNPAGENRGVSVLRIYLKDVSFEIPNSPAIFTEQLNPQVSIEIGTSVEQLKADVFEVVLAVTATAKHEEKVCFLVEVKQAGIFSVTGMEETEKNSALGIFCPSTLFPYARQAVSDLVLNGGFPPLLLTPISFRKLYEEKLSQARQAVPPPTQDSH